MASNKAVSAARKSSIVWLVLSAIILIAGAVFAVGMVIPAYLGMLGEPRVMTPEEVAASVDSLPIYNVQVAGKEMYDTGYYYEDSYAFVTINTEYFGALWMGDQFLPVRAFGGIDETVTSYRGTLRALESDERREVINDMESSEPELRGLFVDAVLDTTDSPTSFENLAMAALALGAVGFGLYGVYRGLTHTMNPNNHPFLKSLSRYGDVDDVVNRIEKERVLGEEKVGRLTLTRSWIIDEKGNNFRAMRAEDVVWVYKHAQRSRYGTNYSVRIYDKYGEMMSVGAKNEKQADEIGMQVAQKAPWALIGYDKQIEDALKNSRSELIAAVEKRKRQPA